MKEDNYLTAGYSLRSWFFTTDHKRIAILYFASLIFFFFIGGALIIAVAVVLVLGPKTRNRMLEEISN